MFHASKKTAATFAAGLTGALALGYGLARVHADGVPKAQPLWYSGTVADASGKPLDSNYNVTFRLFERQDPQAGETPACSVETKSTRIASGRFRIDVSDCADKLKANPDLFTELTVSDGVNAGKPFERAKIGAVPFALEAQHAVSASSALRAQTADTAADTPTMTEWKQYTAKVTSYPSHTEVGNLSTTATWRRVGDTIELSIQTTASASPSAPAGDSFWEWPLPDGVKIDQVKWPSSLVGSAYSYAPGGVTCSVIAAGGGFRLDVVCHGFGSFVGSTVPMPWAKGSFLSISAQFPVAGWSLR